ncbi:MAG: hypothetical protein GXO88_07290 [Chlorobi bacterium]|nr:hypothetical protein [Chlorobiota bacterium]
MLNNPLVYADPTGEFFILDSYLSGYIIGFFSEGGSLWERGINGSLEGKRSLENDAKITNGLLFTDPNKSPANQIWEIISRVTWQAPQTLGGWLTAQWINISGKVNWVDYKYGATVVQTRANLTGVTQGPYIVGNETLEADANNPLFQHEYGHYIQSQSMGWAYYPRVGIPSANSDGNHDFHPVEQDANRRALLYFNEHIDEFYDVNMFDNKGWDFWRNPLNINGSYTRGQIVDFKNPNHFTSLDKIIVRAKWYDHASWLFLPIGGPVWVGLINAGTYNR